MNRILVWSLALVLAAGSAFAQKKGPQLKSQKELEAWQQVTAATTPDARIKAVDDFLANFADTELKSVALFAAAQAAGQKGDSDMALVYAQRALEADPDNYEAGLLMAGTLVQRTKEFDLDREEKLAKAEKYASAALEAAAKAEKPNPQISDDQWADYKKQSIAQAHERLGMVAEKRKKYDVAINEYNQAWESFPEEQSAAVRLAAVYTTAGKPDEALATLDKLTAMSNFNPALKSFVESERKRANAAKNGGAKPAPAPAAGSGSTTPQPSPSPTPQPSPSPTPQQ